MAIIHYPKARVEIFDYDTVEGTVTFNEQTGQIKIIKENGKTNITHITRASIEEL